MTKMLNIYFLSVCFFLIGCTVSERLIPTTEERCKNLEAAEDLDELRKFPRNPAFLLRGTVNFTSIRLDWSLDKKDAVDVCSFTVHVWKTSAAATARALLTRNSHNSMTRSWLVEDLEPGTSYQFAVETIYVTSHQAVSWTLRSYTLGFGPDIPCNCDTTGTVTEHIKDCDRITGQCACKDSNTLGRQCDSCPVGFYMHDVYGCALCDQCPPAKFGGNGSCVFDKDHLMQCSCMEGYTGSHCRECMDGYHKEYIIVPAKGLDPEISYANCTKCDCSINSDTAAVRSCFEKSGNCKSCLFTTTGLICDSCIMKYGGNFLNHTCTDGVTLPAVSNSFVIVVFIVIILLCLTVILFVLYRRYLRGQRTRRFFDEQNKGDRDNVKFSTMMEEPEIDFRVSRNWSSK